MGLTKIRAQQISDIDYKQAVRVITLTDITLSGGAPAEVDGVSLVVGNRILVAGQDPGSENGLYQVQTVGTGSNGTWVRTSDGNEDGEIEAGMIVMVTEGTVYKDTQWKLTTNDPIIIGTTPLVFEQNSAFAFGNIYANGTAVLANTVGDTVTFTAGDNISITGNATAKSVTFAVTGISLNSISNGTSNVTVVSSGGNVTVGVAGSEVAEFSTVGLDVTGNITGSNIATAGELKSTGTFVIGTQQFFAQGSDGFSVNENFNAGNATVTAYHYTSGAGRNGIVFDTAVTGQFTNGFGATGNSAQNKFVSFAEFSNTTWEWRKGVGISAPNLNGGTLLANINPDGNLYTLGTITATGNITGANINGGNLSLTGNVVSALNVTGNITGGNILGNGAGLSGINTFSNVSIDGGNSIVATSISDTLTLVAGTGIVLLGNSVSDTITIAASGSGDSIFSTGGQMGLVTEAVVNSEDLALITDAVTESYDLGEIVTSGVIYPDLLFIGDIADLFILGGTNGQYLGTSGNGVMQWQTLDSAPLAGNLAGNIAGNGFSILDLATLTVTGNITGGNLSVSTGTVSAGNIVNTNSNGVGNIGSESTYFDTVFAKATSAQYADLAECYVADRDYEPGTVVVFGGNREVTGSQIKGDPRVAGVISTNPSFVMNRGLQADHVAAVALVGRVPTRVNGPVRKGDLMISDINGRACACSQPAFGAIIGKSLEDFDGETGIVEVVIGSR